MAPTTYMVVFLKCLSTHLRQAVYAKVSDINLCHVFNSYFYFFLHF